MKYEFVAMKMDGTEAGWLKNFITNISQEMKPTSFV